MKTIMLGQRAYVEKTVPCLGFMPDCQNNGIYTFLSRYKYKYAKTYYM